MHSYEYVYFLDKTISTPLTGYKFISIKHKMSTNKKYFDFRLLTRENLELIVCFSPEKHKLLKVIEQENAGSEIKQFKRTEIDN